MSKRYTTEEYSSLINSALQNAAEAFGDNVVAEAMKYSLENGGNCPMAKSLFEKYGMRDLVKEIAKV